MDPLQAVYRTGPGKLFLEWYSDALVLHGQAVLAAAGEAIRKVGLETVHDLYLSIKVSGVHWHSAHPSRAAEACAGYNSCSDDARDAYRDIAKMLRESSRQLQRPIIFNFTCME